MEMTETEQKFARAALEVFKRYGVRKATMEEIAKEAGVSKPTLYATLKNKDAALGATIRLAKGAAIKGAEEDWARVASLAEKLSIFFERVVLAGFDMLHQAPDAAAFETALGEASTAAIAATRQAEVDAVARMILGAPGLAVVGVDASDYASFVVTSAMNAKRLMQSKHELQDYLQVLGSSVVYTLER